MAMALELPDDIAAWVAGVAAAEGIDPDLVVSAILASHMPSSANTTVVPASFFDWIEQWLEERAELNEGLQRVATKARDTSPRR